MGRELRQCGSLLESILAQPVARGAAAVSAPFAAGATAVSTSPDGLDRLKRAVAGAWGQDGQLGLGEGVDSDSSSDFPRRVAGLGALEPPP